MVDGEPNSEAKGTTHASFSNGLWWLVVVQAGLLVTLIPTSVVFLAVERSVATVALFAVAALPVGPALQAGVYALRRPTIDLRQQPWSRYWEGWRLGWRQSLVMWAPVVVLLAIVQAGSLMMPADAVARPLITVGLILGGVSSVIAVSALTVIATYSFRTRDVPRVALFAMGSKPFSTVGLVGVVAVVVALIALGLEAVLVLSIVLICHALLVISRPMHKLIGAKLVAQPDASAPSA